MAAKKHKPKTKKKPTRKRKPSNLLRLYRINITDQGGKTNVVPMKQIVWTPDGDEVVWRAPGHSVWTVTFDGDNGSPFYASVFSNKPGFPDHSGPVRPDAPANTDFKYTAQIDNAKALDPIIHTDP